MGPKVELNSSAGGLAEQFQDLEAEDQCVSKTIEPGIKEHYIFIYFYKYYDTFFRSRVHIVQVK